MYVLVRDSDQQIVGAYGDTYIRTESGYHFDDGSYLQTIKPGYSLVPVPRQPLRYNEGVIVSTLNELKKRYTIAEKYHLVDYQTGKGINDAIHPFASIEEQIGILRAQIAEILVALGLEPTDKFAKLNAIAAEKIQEGQKKKEMLNDAKDS